MRPSGSNSGATGASRQPSLGRAIGWRSHAYRRRGHLSIRSRQSVSVGDRVHLLGSRGTTIAGRRRLAFHSARSGGTIRDIWTAEADGSNPQQLTRGPGDDQGSPSWSPDGRRIVFDSRGTDFHIHLWMIDADGGGSRRFTADAGDQVVPTWSHDERWIYYTWRQADTRDTGECPRMAASQSG